MFFFLPEFYRVLLDCMGVSYFEWVLLSFTGFDLVLIGFFKVLPSFTYFYLFVPSFKVVFWGFTGFYQVPIGSF